jgi:hypothetical protein
MITRADRACSMQAAVAHLCLLCCVTFDTAWQKELCLDSTSISALFCLYLTPHRVGVVMFRCLPVNVGRRWATGVDHCLTPPANHIIDASS